MNIFDFAMKMELEGKDFYEKLARESQSEGLRKIFTELAQDEQKHYEIFSRLKERDTAVSMSDSQALEGARSLFSELSDAQECRSLLTSNLDGYRYAMDAEQKSVALYLDAAEKESDDNARKLLFQIAEEEKKHFKILENVYEFVNSPGHTLVWGEWGNLDEAP